MKTYHKIVAFVGSALMLGSCADYLIREPQDALDPATFFSSQENAVIAVNGIYNAALEPVKGRTYAIDFDCMSDNMYNYSRNQNTQEFGQGTHGSSSIYALNFWSRGYRGISRANTLLAWLDHCYEITVPATNIKDRLRSEALFLRAYFYSELIDFFGDVPMYLEQVDLADSKPRTPKAQVVEQILGDLEEAARHLPVTYAAEDTGRATSGAALALKGKIELYNGMYAQAAETLKEVIDLKDENGALRYDLYPLYRELFLPQNENNCEVIFDIQYMKNAYSQGLSHQLYTFTYEWNSYCPTASLAECYYTKNGYPVSWDAETQLYKSADPAFDPTYPYKDRDPRLDQSIIMPGTDNGRGTIFLPSSSNHTGMKIRKWNDYTETEKNNSEHNIILIRFADVLLMRAEALVESGTFDEAEVRGLIDRVRQRPSVMMPKVEDVEGTELDANALRAIIRHERRVEFAFEGTRISDIRRWRIGPEMMTDAYGYRYQDVRLNPPKYIPYKVDTRSFNPNRDYLWPIPQNEINTNPYINAPDQNPGY